MRRHYDFDVFNVDYDRLFNNLDALTSMVSKTNASLEETPESYTLTAALPGADRGDISVEVLTENTLKLAYAPKKPNKHARAFTENWSLPKMVQERVSVRYSDGLLVVSAPKRVETKATRKLDIQ